MAHALSPSPHTSLTRMDGGLAVLLGLLSILLRLIHLTNIPAVVYDEVVFTDLARSIARYGSWGTTAFWGMDCSDRYYPLQDGYAALLAVVYTVFGIDVLQSRLVSVVGYGLAIGLCYLLARCWSLERGAALMAGFILATDFVTASQAVIGRADTYVLSLGLLAMLCAQRAQTTGARWLLAAGLCVGIGVWFHLIAMLWLVNVLVWRVAARGQASARWRGLIHDGLMLGAGFAVIVLPFAVFIAAAPDIFLKQFALPNSGANVSPTLWARFLNQFVLLYQNYRYEPLTLGAAAWGAVQALRHRPRPSGEDCGLRRLCWRRRPGCCLP